MYTGQSTLDSRKKKVRNEVVENEILPERKVPWERENSEKMFYPCRQRTGKEQVHTINSANRSTQRVSSPKKGYPMCSENQNCH